MRSSRPRVLRQSLRGLFACSLFGGGIAYAAADVEAILKEAVAAEAKLDSRRALALFVDADQARPNEAVILQKIAQQYSDLIDELPDDAERKRYAQTALAYAQRAVAVDPRNAVAVLSLAVCHGKLAGYSDTRTKLEYSRQVKAEAERAIALDPSYAWAHHVLGRWHHEVAALGGPAKIFVRLIYGGLPEASASRAIACLSRAVELEPGELAHRLELGFAYLADAQPVKARAEFEKGLAMPSRKKYDDTAKERARVALNSLGKT